MAFDKQFMKKYEKAFFHYYLKTYLIQSTSKEASRLIDVWTLQVVHL